MPNFFNKYPYTDFHELNLDWVLEQVKTNTETVEQNVQANQQFKEDLTEQQTNFERGMNNWKRDTETALNGWKHDTEEAYQGQIDDLEGAYTQFLEDYQRTFGIVDTFGSSTTDAISQARATEIHDNQVDFIRYDFTSCYLDSDFRRGTLLANGTINPINYRIMSNYVFTAADRMIITPKTGWRFSISPYVGGTMSSLGNLDTDTKTVEKGDTFKIVIARVTEDPSEVADYHTFMNGLEVMTNTGSKNDVNVLKRMTDASLIASSGSEFSVVDTANGSINTSGAYVSGISYRLATPNPISIDHDIYIEAATGFMFSIAVFSSGVLQNEPNFGTDRFFVPAGSTIRFAIKRVTDITGETADRLEFLAGIKVVVPAMPYKPLSSFNMATGKVMNCLGDSYVANNGQPFSDTWFALFAEHHNMERINYGMNGTTITPSDPPTGTSISERARTMGPADYIIVVGGKNDYNLQIPLTDFRQAVSDLIDYLVQTYTDSQICFFTPWKVSEATEIDIGESAKTIPLYDYIDVIVDECNKHGVACYDTKNSGIYTFDSTFRHNYFQGDNDVSHLNADGHALFYPRAEKFILSTLG